MIATETDAGTVYSDVLGGGSGSATLAAARAVQGPGSGNLPLALYVLIVLAAGGLVFGIPALGMALDKRKQQ